jgi:hypothetical protein
VFWGAGFRPNKENKGFGWCTCRCHPWDARAKSDKQYVGLDRSTLGNPVTFNLCEPCVIAWLDRDTALPFLDYCLEKDA